MRCDFNVPLANGKIVDDFRLQRALPTINLLKRAGAKIILISHLGDPQEFKNKRKRQKQLTLRPISQRLCGLLRERVIFSKKIKGGGVERLIRRMKPGDIVLLENLRLDAGEEKNDPKFAKQLAKLGDVYINEAFSVCHREHASVVALPKLMKHFAGPELKQELHFLSQVVENPPRPLVVLIGGAKIESKIKVLKRFFKIADYLLLAGEIANTVLAIKGLWMGEPSPSQEEISLIGEINLTDQKIYPAPLSVSSQAAGIAKDVNFLSDVWYPAQRCGVYLPLDVLASADPQGETLIRETAPGAVRQDEDVFDIGQETINLFCDVIKQAGAIFWSGPLGWYEKEKFSNGTREIAQHIAKSPASLRLAGGGDTVAALRHFNLADRFSFVSTGGGAMLGFLAGEKMPGLEAIGLVEPYRLSDNYGRN